MATSVVRGGYIREWFNSGFSPQTTSITRRSTDVVNIFIVTLLAQGFDYKKKYYGDTLTWDELEMSRLKFGTATSIRWVTPQPGWEYKYDVIKAVWAVVDNLGNTLETFKTHDIADFGITWDIISSHNFYLWFSLDYQSSECFLKAWKIPRWYKYDPGTGGIVPIHPSDEVSTTTRDFDYRLLAVWGDMFASDAPYNNNSGGIAGNFSHPLITLKNELEQSLFPPPEPMHILRPRGPVREQSGDYSTFEVTHGERGRSSTPTKLRDSNMMDIAEILLSVVFATVAYRGKPVFEPWMLWEIWKWLGKGIGTPAKQTIFDIIPNWG